MVSAIMFKQRFNVTIFYFLALNEKGMGNSPNYCFTKLLHVFTVDLIKPVAQYCL
jgi:hypothetical protein